jgi:hypothetical protein
VAVASVALALASAPALAQVPDCAGPAGDPEPNTPEWDQRDRDNQYCAEERHADHQQHPVLAPTAPSDQYREPTRLDDVRFRYEYVEITNRDGDVIEAEIYAPCRASGCPDLPAGLRTFEPPYPGAVIIHGGASRRELHWWSSQPLAEAGYLVVALDTVSSLSGHQPDTEDVIDWLFATPTNPTAQGEFNLLWQEFDGQPIGIAGHSAGGVAVNVIGHADPRVGAVASWDRAQSSAIPPERDVNTPTVFFMADYNCQQVPFCQPEDYPEPPNPDGLGNKGGDYLVLKAAGVDAMQIPLRAALHLDWTPSELAGNRYAELVNMYFTTAWFDRHVRGDTDFAWAWDAHRRLTADVFSDVADAHHISQGFYDPALAALAGDPYAGNVPYAISGMPVADRLSFYFLGKCDITVPGSDVRTVSDDMRQQGCALLPEPGLAAGLAAGGLMLSLIARRRAVRAPIAR